VRLVWAYVERQDLKGFYEDIRAVGRRRGTLGDCAGNTSWIVVVCHPRRGGSAREIARLTEAHDAYRWLCGGAQVNDHTLSDFRTDHGEALDELLSVRIASLMAAGVVKLKQVAQDGMRVRPVPGWDRFGARRNWKLPGRGATEGGPRAAGASGEGVGAVAGARSDQAAARQKGGRSAGIDYRCRGDGDEDGRRRLPAGDNPQLASDADSL